MKEKFKEYYPLTNEEFKKLWNKGLFVFDTSIMLNTYRCSIPLLDQFMLILDKLEDRIWLPNQVGREFLKNRKGVMYDVEEFYSNYIKHIDESFEIAKQTIIKEYQPKNQYTYLEDDLEKLKKEILVHQEKLKKIIDEKKEEIKKQIINEQKSIISTKEDDILNKITSKFSGKIGDAFTEEELKEIYEEGAKRYQEKKPPGYKDQNDKEGNDQYGDLVLWKEIIKRTENKNIPVVLVIDDNKEDWWWKVKGKNQGARIELIKEITAKTDNLFYMYDFKNFLKYSNEYLLEGDEKTSPNLLNEAEKISSSTELDNFILKFEKQLQQRYLPCEMNLKDSSINFTRKKTSQYYANKIIDLLYTNSRPSSSNYAFIHKTIKQVLHYLNTMKWLTDDAGNLIMAHKKLILTDKSSCKSYIEGFMLGVNFLEELTDEKKHILDFIVDLIIEDLFDNHSFTYDLDNDQNFYD